MSRVSHITRLFAVLVVALSVAACESATTTWRTVLSSLEGGIGGTGLSDDWGGIGGTGVVGTISGFGSIIVNDLHIQYAPDDRVDTANGPMTAARLAIGQVVAVRAQWQNGQFVAQSIGLHYAVVGPVDAYDVQTGQLRINGIPVRLEAQASLAVSPDIGRVVAVSGLFDGQAVRATRLDPMSPTSMGRSVDGLVTAVTGSRVTVNGRVFDSGRPQNIAVGDRVVLRGAGLTDGRATVSVERSYGPAFDNQVQNWSEERVSATTETRTYWFGSRTRTGAFKTDGEMQIDSGSWRATSHSLQDNSPGSTSSTESRSHTSSSGHGSDGGGSGGSGGGGGGGGRGR